MKPWQVDDVMTRDVVSVRVDTPYRDVVELLIKNRIGAVPVTDEREVVVGVVSESDLLPKVAAVGAPPPGLPESWWHRAARAKAAGRVAGDLMTAPAVTVRPSLAVAAAARRMQEVNVRRLPVVNDLGRLAGIVTRSNLLRIHLRNDVDISHEIGEEVLHGPRAAELGDVYVRTRDGVVALSGRVHFRSTALDAVAAAEQIRGVVAVVDELAFDIDDRVATAP